MAITLEKFKPELANPTPVESASDLTLALAVWKAQPNVTLTNNPGNFQIGWVQALVRQNIIAAYDNNSAANRQRWELRVGCDPLPIRDSIGAAPWYYNHPEYAPTIVAPANGSIDVRPKMYDAPRDPIAWACPKDITVPLVDVQYELSFRTWLVVRDLALPLNNQFTSVLYNFMYTVNAAYKIDTTQAVGKRVMVRTKPTQGIEAYTPPLPIPSVIWKPEIANNSLTFDWVHTMG